MWVTCDKACGHHPLLKTPAACPGGSLLHPILSRLIPVSHRKEGGKKAGRAVRPAGGARTQVVPQRAGPKGHRQV